MARLTVPWAVPEGENGWPDVKLWLSQENLLGNASSRPGLAFQRQYGNPAEIQAKLDLQVLEEARRGWLTWEVTSAMTRLKALDQDAWYCFRLHEIPDINGETRDYADIAENLAISKGQVSKKITKAREWLQGELVAVAKVIGRERNHALPAEHHEPSEGYGMARRSGSGEDNPVAGVTADWSELPPRVTGGDLSWERRWDDTKERCAYWSSKSVR